MPIPFLRLPSAKAIRSTFDYNPKTGRFTWRETGIDAGSLDKSRPTRIRVKWKNKSYAVHRLIWKWVHGVDPPELDHRNVDPTDNRISNLRKSTRSKSSANRRNFKNNTSGFKGVERLPSGNFRAKVILNKNIVSRQTFATAEEAYAAYCAKGKKAHGEFFHK